MRLHATVSKDGRKVRTCQSTAMPAAFTAAPQRAMSLSRNGNR